MITNLNLDRKTLSRMIDKIAYKNAIVRDEIFDSNVKYLLENDKLTHLILAATFYKSCDKTWNDAYRFEKLAEKIILKVLIGEWRK